MECLNDKTPIVHSRFAEALILSIRGGQELLLKTQARYFQQAAGEGKDVSSVALIEAVAMGSWEKMVQHCDLDSWREVLAALVTYTDANTKQVSRCGREKSGNISLLFCYRLWQGVLLTG